MNTPPPFFEPGAAATVLRNRVQTALKQLASCTSYGDKIHVHTVFDRDSDHYLLVAEGWEGYRRVYRTLAHIALTVEAVHIYEDGTIDGIAEQLRASGVPAEQIVCEWSQLPVPIPDADG